MPGNPNWVKGVSANPSGKPKDYEGISELARSFGSEMIRILRGIAKNRKAPMASRVSAAALVLDRGFGKSPSFSTSDPADFKRATEMSDAELIAIARAGGIEVDVSRETKSVGEYPGAQHERDMLDKQKQLQ
jgi:hypothetical protein